MDHRVAVVVRGCRVGGLWLLPQNVGRWRVYLYGHKEQQLGLFADRASRATLRANQLRLYFASFACVLMHGLRRLGHGAPHDDV